MRPNELESVEVQPGAAAGWEYGSSGASGVIKITLKKGLASGASERPVAAPCVVPAFPRDRDICLLGVAPTETDGAPVGKIPTTSR